MCSNQGVTFRDLQIFLEDIFFLLFFLSPRGIFFVGMLDELPVVALDVVLSKLDFYSKLAVYSTSRGLRMNMLQVGKGQHFYVIYVYL